MKVLNKLTIKHLTMNKKRTIVTIVGVILSCALMVGIGLIISTFRDAMIRDIELANGNHHLKIKNIPSDKLDIIKLHQSIESYKLQTDIGYSYINSEELNEDNKLNYFYIGSMDENILKKLTLKEGNLPENNNEIIITANIIKDEISNYKIGDEIVLEIGNRYDNDIIIEETDSLFENEVLKDIKTQKYKIVGIIDDNYIYTGTQLTPYQMYTKHDELLTGKSISYITFKNVKKSYKIGNEISKSIGFDIDVDSSKYYSNVIYNNSLLSLHGSSKYDNYNNMMISSMAIILSLVSVACIIVIYNSFAISVMERKKQFGLFSSIGATKKQLRKTVFFEAIIIGLIGIPIGILSGFIGIWTVIQIINSLISEATMINLDLSVYPLFIIIPILFMIIVIFISAFLPAHKASKITPIEAIRLNDDIKIKGKKIKTNKLVTKIFGVEGEIAFKNMKRNKKKYRITVVSLFISIVLFVSFSSFLKYGLTSSVEALGDLDYDIYLYVHNNNDEDNNKIYNDLLKTNGVTKGVMIKTYQLYSEISKDNLSNDFKKIMGLEKITDNYSSTINLNIMDKENYQKLKKEIGLDKDQPIILNQYNMVVYTNNNRKNSIGKIFNEDSSMKLKIQFTNSSPQEENEQNSNNTNVDYFELEDAVFTNKIPFGFKQFLNTNIPTIIVTDDFINSKLINDSEYNIISTSMIYETDDTKPITEKYENISEDIKGYSYFSDLNKELKTVRNLIFIIKLLLYGFISLVTLIGVTSVFNTINTSIALRRTEFSVLRSIGLTPKGFNKILRFETIMFGFKSLFYALPVSIGITYLIYRSISDVVGLSFMLPWNSIIIAIVGVFIIVSIAMTYATNKMKHENILDAIREENI